MRAALFAALLACAGCEVTCNKTHEVSEKIGKRVLSIEHEQKLGAQLAAQLRAEVRVVEDPRLTALGDDLVAAAGDIPDGMQFRFAVIDAPDTINAIAMPGGYIYVFSGLLAQATGDELAGVLAHEIAHVAERHVAAQIVTAYGISAVREIILGSERSRLGAAITDFLTRGASGAFSRTAEREADDLAIRMLVRAGRDPRGYVTFFEKLARQQRGGGRLARFLASHPDPAERAERARQQIAKLVR